MNRVKLRSCLNLEERDFPPLQRETVKQTKREGQENKRIQPHKMTATDGLKNKTQTVVPLEEAMSIQQSAQKNDAQAALTTTIQPDMTLKTEPVIRILKRPEGNTKVPVTETQRAEPVISILKQPETTTEIQPAETPTAEPAMTKIALHQLMAQKDNKNLHYRGKSSD